jgi:hypothetical protein
LHHGNILRVRIHSDAGACQIGYFLKPRRARIIANIGIIQVAEMQPTPRKLTTLQKAVLIRALREFPTQHVEVRYFSLASDARSYAQDFLAVFKAIGWEVDDAVCSDDLADRFTGLGYVVNERESLPPSAEALRDSLRIYGIEIVNVCDTAVAVRSADFILAIGAEA